MIQYGDSSCWLTVRMWHSVMEQILALAVLQPMNIPLQGCALKLLLLTLKNRMVLLSSAYIKRVQTEQMKM